MGLFRKGAYANVTATLALVVALGGTSYAAVTITGQNIKNGSVRLVDLGGNAVNSARVVDGSLKKTDFAAGQLPAGPQGATGPQGPQGPTGARGPSDAFASFHDGAITSSLSGPRTVLSLSVPAGTFVVNAKTQLTNNSSTGALYASCDLLAGGDSDTDRFLLQRSSQSPSESNTQVVPLQVTHTFTAPGTVLLRCNGFGLSVTNENSKITAVQVAALTNSAG